MACLENLVSKLREKTIIQDKYRGSHKELPYPLLHRCSVSAMGSVHEKDDDSVFVGSEPRTRAEFYDPSKESVWTRVGLTFESFKRAPGTTG
jgi:hypothetical protein